MALIFRDYLETKALIFYLESCLGSRESSLMCRALKLGQNHINEPKIPYRELMSWFEALSLVHFGQILTARSTQLPLYIVGRTTNNGPPQMSFHMTSLFR
jgi:hypothetical protein